MISDHVTLKTGVMAAEHLALPSQEYILFYWNRIIIKTFSKILPIPHFCVYINIYKIVPLSMMTRNDTPNNYVGTLNSPKYIPLNPSSPNHDNSKTQGTVCLGILSNHQCPLTQSMLSKSNAFVFWGVCVITHSGKNSKTSISHMWAASSLQDPEEDTCNVNERLCGYVCCAYLRTDEESFTWAIGSWGRGQSEKRLWCCCSQTHKPSAVCDNRGTNSQSRHLWFAARWIKLLSHFQQIYIVCHI